MGVHRTVNVAEESLEQVVKNDNRFGPDLVVDCVGTQLSKCLDLARVGGRISLFGMNSQARPSVPQNEITRKELSIYGSYVGVNTFPRAIEILENRVIEPSVLISKSAALEEIKEAIDALRQGEEMKIVIRHSE